MASTTAAKMPKIDYQGEGEGGVVNKNKIGNIHKNTT